MVATPGLPHHRAAVLLPSSSSPPPPRHHNAVSAPPPPLCVTTPIHAYPTHASDRPIAAPLARRLSGVRRIPCPPTRPHRACASLRVRFACGVAAHAGHPPRCTPLHCASPASRHSAASRISTASAPPAAPTRPARRAVAARAPPRPHVSFPARRRSCCCRLPHSARYPLPLGHVPLRVPCRVALHLPRAPQPPRLPLRRLSRLPSFALPSDVAYHALAVTNVVPSLVPRASTLDGVLRFPYAPTRDFSTARLPHHTLHIYTHPTVLLPTVVPHSASPHPPLPCEWRP